MARLLTLVLGFTAVVQLNAAPKEAILKPGKNVDLQCSDSKVIVPEYVRYQNKAPGGEDCVLDRARVSIITSCFNKETCSASAIIANDCDRGSEDIVVKYECVSRSKIVTACSSPVEVTGDFPPFYWISPNYPQSYNGGDECEIKVNSASNAMYKVSFLDLEFEPRAERSPGCYDKVVITNEQTEAYTYEYCGSMTDVKTGEDLVKVMEHLKMKIITDDQQHMRGMLIKVGETSAAETTTTTTTATTTTTVSTTTRPEPVKTSSTKETTQSTKRPDTATAATPKSTMSSTTGESVTLPSFDNCASSPCKNNGTCVDEFGFFFCTCELGFSGYNCEIVLNATLDQCEYKPCRHGGTCVDDYQTFRCICRPGYGGTRCEELVDIGHRTSSASRPVTSSAVLVLLTFTVLSHLSS